MNIGNLYKVKEYFWLLYPTKETALDAAATVGAAAAGQAAAHVTTGPLAAGAAAAWYSRRCNCEVTYFSPDSYIVFLEEDGELKRVLTSEGLIGWTWFNESYNDYFEEVKAKS